MPEAFNFSNNLQGPPAAVNAIEPLDQQAKVANLNQTNATTGEINANTQHIGSVTAGQDLSNQQAQLLLNQRQAAIDAWQKVQTAHEVNNTPSIASDASKQGSSLPIDNSTGQPAQGTGVDNTTPNNTPTDSHITKSAYNTNDTMDQYWDQLMKSGAYTPQEIQSMRLGWQNNQSDAVKKAADAEGAIADVQQKKAVANEANTKAQVASAQYLGTALLPVQKAIDQKDMTTANGLYTAAVGHMTDLAVHQATEAAGRPLTSAEAAAVRSQVASQFPPINGGVDANGNTLPNTKLNPDALNKIKTIVGASEAGQAYYKTQQDIEASKAKVTNDKMETAIKQGALTVSAGKDLAQATTNAQQTAQLTRDGTMLKKTDALIANLRDEYGPSAFGTEFKNAREVLMSDLKPRQRTVIQALLPDALTGQGADQRVNLYQLMQVANAKVTGFDAQAMSIARVRGALGSDFRAKNASKQASEYDPSDSNDTFSTKRALREQYIDSIAGAAQDAQKAENNQAKLIIQGAKQGSPKLDLKPEDFVVPVVPYKQGKETPTLVPGVNDTPAVPTPNGGKSKIIASKTLTFNPATGKIE